MTLKLNPILIDLVMDTGYIVSDCNLFWSDRKPHPTPTSKLNEGPAKLAVVAMSGIPLRAIATFALKSPKELPQANIVTPIIGAGMRQIVPRNWSSPTRWLPMTSIHVVATKKPYNESGTCWCDDIMFHDESWNITMPCHEVILVWLIHVELTAAINGNFSSPPKRITENATTSADTPNMTEW